MIAVYPGSFDPMTFGHMDVISRASNIFDELVIAIPDNTSGLLSVAIRQQLIDLVYADQGNISITVFQGLLVDWMQVNGYNIIVRGIRDSVDMANEWRMAHCNQIINSGIETLFLASSPVVSHISSSLVREIIACKGDLAKFVPDIIADYITQQN